ncbi:MAG: hypothetical protein KKE44_06145 [Proteobacteria bacterium]|nr:hypothetical protein [Pseudomonadota bacterium]MBU1582309.1 hypothetical protein [Pseudomonadota bacterium]MBU2631753.1 hypothetical protein [Pseudomonadota bacterium]
MKKERKKKQRILQVSFGLGLILLVVLIELLAVHPSGIYSYSQNGYKEFQIKFSKEQVLKKINKQKNIRTIRVCDPDRVFVLTSRKPFEMQEQLAASNTWICHGRTGLDFLFLFKKNLLERILVQRLRFGKKEVSILFTQCNPEILKEIDTYLATREKLSVFYDTDSGVNKNK